ncbi:DUF721 domain-containing protein [Actinomycetaceae bacterium TAE3-ERU4]|nr:DUF721 domain-containing protein [Actinomycetaceae bacterium TAE3-ERU4]
MSEENNSSDLPRKIFLRAREQAFSAGDISLPMNVFDSKRSVVSSDGMFSGSWNQDSRESGYSIGPGFPRTTTGPGRSARDPVSMREGFSKFTAEHQQELGRARLRQNWGNIVGPNIGAHTRIESMEENKLVIRADSTAWKNQLRLLLPQLMKTIDAQALGLSQVIVVGPNNVSWKKGPLSVRGRGPRDTYG